MKANWYIFIMLVFIAACTQKQVQKTEVEYTRLTPTDFRKRMAEAPVAYLPLGTFEWHGEHLPLGADSLQSTAFFNELTNQAGGIVMPMLFLGPNPRLEKDGNTFYGMDFWYDEGSMKQAPTPSKLDGSAYWVSDSLFVQFLEGTLANLVRAGFKMVVAHGHGPSTNQFNQHLASWETKFGMKLMSCWFENNNAENGIMCDHAAMNETSLVMHYFPELVKMNQLPIDTAQELRGVAGKDPRKFASPELGREIVEQNLERMKVLIKNELGNL